VSLNFPCTAHAFFPEHVLIISRIFVALLRRFTKKFDAVPLSDPSRSHIRPDTRPQIKGRKNEHVKFYTLTSTICQYYYLPLHGATTTAVQMAALVPEIVEGSGTLQSAFISLLLLLVSGFRAFNGGRSSSSSFPNCPHALVVAVLHSIQVTKTHANNISRLKTNSRLNQLLFTTIFTSSVENAFSLHCTLTLSLKEACF
jgi:hypothetical protein